MALIEIKHRFTGSVLFELDCGGIKICLEAALKAGADLRGADLRGAYLRGANLGGADLSGADLYGADLYGANLRDDAKLLAGAPVIQLSFAHGWELQLFNTDKGIRVVCGCRGPWAVEKARKHWQEHLEEQRRSVVLPALEALLALAKAQGWGEEVADE